MDIEAYYKSLTFELQGLRDRVRHILGGRHWPTDGGWKESVLRNALRRGLGGSTEVGQGFIVQGEAVSRQVDVLLYRADAPVLFRDGNLVVVSASAVQGVIEVKTRADRRTLEHGLRHLAEIAGTVGARYRHSVFLGLFAYETVIKSNQVVLDMLREICAPPLARVNAVCHGPSHFVRYWPTEPHGGGGMYERWHSYHMPDQAFGYFIQNFVSHTSPSGLSHGGLPWFPRRGKEPFKDGEAYPANAFMERLDTLLAEDGKSEQE